VIGRKHSRVSISRALFKEEAEPLFTQEETARAGCPVQQCCSSLEWNGAGGQESGGRQSYVG
jgi:hypothetical protein